jgi:hypothetical protein
MNKISHEEDLLKKWVQAWQTAAIELEKLRQDEIRRANTQMAIENLDDAFQAALLHFPPRPSSGLVEQQRLFHQSKS